VVISQSASSGFARLRNIALQVPISVAMLSVGMAGYVSIAGTGRS
jgi:hypothetical protein